MTVCLKCGAENPPTNQYCVRCEMPLPHSGVGGTLQGGALERPVGTQPLAAAAAAQQPAPRAPAAGLGQTLFGVSPVAPAAAAPAVAAPAVPGPAAPAQAPGPVPAAPGLAQTLFGVAPAPAGRAPAPAQPARGPAQTAPGVVPPAAAAGAPASAAGLAQRTLLGVAPQGPAARPAPSPHVVAPHSAFSAQHEAAADPGRLHPGNTAPFEPVRNASTLLGTSGFPQLARPLAAPSPTADTAPAGSDALAALAALPRAAEPAAPEAAPGPGVALTPLHARTQLGVAIPGIAPLRSGAGPVATSPDARPLPAEEPPPPSAIAPSRFKVPRGALVLLGSGALLLTAAIAFALLWTGARPISATVASDPSGRERIDLVCSDCPDGTQLTLGEVSAEVRDRKAYLLPAAPLALGENKLQLAMQKPGEGPQQVELRLPPVEYRIHPDTSTLVGDQPRLRLDLEALPGTQVQLGKDLVPIDAQGHGVQEIDVSGQLLGQSTDIATFEEAVPYVITPPSGKTYRGELRVKIGITPLLLEAPGTDSVTDLERFMLAGRTTKGADVWVAGSALPVDANGRFAQLMSIESVGQTNVTVRASQRGLAPRFASFRLERVKSLEAALSARKPGALTLAEVVKDIPGSVGRALLLRGRVEEVRVEGQRSLLILAADDCTGRDCLARLSYGGLRKLERGARVTALGKVLGTAANQNVPEIEVSLLL
ncbi:MAG TPA: hypothetical protein VFS67_33550 [Polyangiaceae bacterium]|nr:hypothetical protein [Polyangiaceae bacterium]